eukprot:575249-Amphidinium_carterae.4
MRGTISLPRGSSVRYACRSGALSLSQAAWHCVGSLFGAPLSYATTENRASILPNHWQAGVQQVDWNFNPRARPRQPGWPAEGRPLQMVHSLVVPVEPPLPPAPSREHREWEDWLDRPPNSSQLPMPHFGRDKRPSRATPQQLVVHEALREPTSGRGGERATWSKQPNLQRARLDRRPSLPNANHLPSLLTGQLTQLKGGPHLGSQRDEPSHRTRGVIGQTKMGLAPDPLEVETSGWEAVQPVKGHKPGRHLQSPKVKESGLGEPARMPPLTRPSDVEVEGPRKQHKGCQGRGPISPCGHRQWLQNRKRDLTLTPLESLLSKVVVTISAELRLSESMATCEPLGPETRWSWLTPLPCVFSSLEIAAVHRIICGIAGGPYAIVMKRICREGKEPLSSCVALQRPRPGRCRGKMTAPCGSSSMARILPWKRAHQWCMWKLGQVCTPVVHVEVGPGVPALLSTHPSQYRPREGLDSDQPPEAKEEELSPPGLDDPRDSVPQDNAEADVLDF